MTEVVEVTDVVEVVELTGVAAAEWGQTRLTPPLFLRSGRPADAAGGLADCSGLDKPAPSSLEGIGA